MKHAIVLLLIAALGACATLTPPPQKSQFATLIDKWVGRSADELVAQSGPPEEVFMLDSGGRVYSYLKSQMAERNSETKADLTKRLNRQDYDKEILRESDPWSVTPAYPNLAPDTTGVRTRPIKRKIVCKLLFKVSATGVIESWAAEGDGCE
jgi:hypothetical protein